MEGLLLTVVLGLLMFAAIVVLGRSWPRSSRIGGYRARRPDGMPSAPEAPTVPEDDEVHWDWTRDDGSPPGTDR